MSIADEINESSLELTDINEVDSVTDVVKRQDVQSGTGNFVWFIGIFAVYMFLQAMFNPSRGTGAT